MRGTGSSGFCSVDVDRIAAAVCRNAAQCESLGHRPRKRQKLNVEALKGRDGDARSFRPFGAFDFRFAVSQGVALGFHILCLWHSTLCTSFDHRNSVSTSKRANSAAMSN